MNRRTTAVTSSTFSDFSQRVAPTGRFAGRVSTHRHDGVLVPPADPQALAEAVVTLARDPELAATYGAAARRTVLARFDAATMVRETLAGYDATCVPLADGSRSGW